MPGIDEPRTMGAPCWVDLTSGDLATMKSFYTALFGWEYEEMGEEFGNYNIITKDGDIVGGAMQYSPDFMGPEEINAWSIYFSTSDIEDSLKKAQDQGGQQVVPPMQISDQGTMAEGLDDSGTMFGLWQPGTLQGFAKWGEHGFPGWFELHTREFEKAKSFYAALLGGKTSTMDMEGGPQYATIEIDGAGQAGIFEANTSLPEGVPNFWAVYFIVDDTDTAVSKAQELGGSVMVPPTDSPFGRMSLLQDPKGTFFFVISGDGDMS